MARSAEFLVSGAERGNILLGIADTELRQLRGKARSLGAPFWLGLCVRRRTFTAARCLSGDCCEDVIVPPAFTNAAVLFFL